VNADGQKDILFADGSIASVPISFPTATITGQITCSVGTTQFVICHPGIEVAATPPADTTGIPVLTASVAGNPTFTGSEITKPANQGNPTTYILSGLNPNIPYTVTVVPKPNSGLVKEQGNAGSISGGPGVTVNLALWILYDKPQTQPPPPPPGGGGGGPIDPICTDPSCYCNFDPINFTFSCGSP
jgi:hypothetical protein